MRLKRHVARILAVGLIVGGMVGIGGTAHAGGPAQASNVNVGVLSPGQDEGSLDTYNQCGTSNPHNSAGYYSFPSKQSPVDNGLQTDIGNDQGMLKVTFDLPSSVNSGTVNITAPNPPRPSTVPGSAPFGTVFPHAYDINPAAASLYGCTVPPGNDYTVYYYAVTIDSGGTNYFQLEGGVNQNSTAPNQVGIPFSFPAGQTASSVTVYIANVVNPPEGTYSGVNYTVGVNGSTTLPAPASDSTSFVASTPDATTSQLTSSLTTANPTLTATNVPSDGAVLTATIYDAFYNPIAGDSVYIGVNGGPGGAETAPIGSTSTGGGNGEPQTGSNGEAQYYAYGTEATPPGDPDTFFAQDTTAGIFVDQPPPTPADTLATVSIPIVAADPSPPSVPGSGSSVSAFGGTTVSPVETQVTADGSSTATISVTLVDQFGNAATDQAVILQPIEPSPPAASESFKHVVISPVDPPTPGDACSQGPSSQIPGISCTDGNGTTQFTVSDTLAQSVSFEITDLTDGYVLPYLYLPTDVPNIPIVDFLPGAVSPTTSTVSVDGAATAEVLANGTSQATVDVTLLDAESNPEVGKRVSVAGSAGTSSTITPTTPAAEISTLQAQGCPVPAAGVTDCDGNAYFTVSDGTVEAVTYTATDVTDHVSLTGAAQQPIVSFVTGAVSAGGSTVTVSPGTVVGDGQGVATVTVTVVDGGGHPLDGEPVTLDTSGNAALTAVPPSATSNAAGVATFAVRASSPIGPVSLPVSVGAVDLTAGADIIFSAVPDPTNTTVTATPASPEATGSPDVTVKVSVADSSDDPIAGLSLELVGGAVPATPPRATTGSNGVATFDVGADLPSPPAVDYSAVDLSDNDRTLGTAIVDYVPVPDETHESSVTASPAATYTFVSGQPAAVQSSTVSVDLKDSTGTAITGDTVDLTASSPNAVVTPVAGGVSNGSGVATLTVTDPDPEQVTFTATDATTGIQILETATVSFVLRPDENTTSTITASPTTVEANGLSESTVTVTLHNNGALLSGDTVSLSEGSGSSIITTSDPVSNAGGQVQFEVTDLTAQSVAYQATDLTTATELTHDAVVTFTTPPGGSLQPSVTAITPTSGPGTGGTEVTVTGVNLAGATGVTFGTQPAPTYTVNPAGTELVAVSPIPTAAGSVNVTVTGPGGTSPAVAADVFTYTSAPALRIAAVSPSSGPVTGGTRVTLAGTGLLGVTSVSFGSVTTKVKTNNGSTVTVIAPAAKGAGRVHVIASSGDGRSTTGPMNVFAFVKASHPGPPAITSVRPSSGPTTGGTVVTVGGTDLSHATKVLFGTVSGTHLDVNAAGTSLSVRSPAAKRSGIVRLTVETPAGSSTNLTTDRYTYVAASVYHRFAEPQRLLNTAAKGGGGPLGPGAKRTIAAAGTAGIPEDATRVVVRLTVTAGNSATGVTIWPAGGDKPSSASVSAAARKSADRTVSVALGTRGRLALFNRAGEAGIIVMVVGYDAPAASTRRAGARSSTTSPVLQGAPRP